MLVMDIIGQDLSSWRAERWYELRAMTGETGSKVIGYFTDANLAAASGKGEGWYGSDGMVGEVTVLTQDGVIGFILDKESITLEEDAARRAVAIQKALDKLTPEERELLGIVQCKNT